MPKERLAAFSDGVIAIIITIMVLELHVPQGAGLAALSPLLPTFLTYVLSFIYVAIYWNNHHHLLHAATRVNGTILWANTRWLNSVLFAANIVLAALIIERDTRSAWSAMVGALLLLVAVPLLKVHSMAWSEPTFVFFSLLALLWLSQYARHGGGRSLIAAAVAVGLGVLARYAGLSLVGAGIAVVLATRRALRPTLRDCGIFAVISGLLSSVWPGRNWMVAGRLSGRPPVFHPLRLAHLQGGLQVVAGWLRLGGGPRRLALSVVAIGALALVLRYAMKRLHDAPRLADVGTRSDASSAVARTALIFVTVYNLFVLVTISFVDASMCFDSRILSPVLAWALIGGVCGAYRVTIDSDRRQRTVLLVAIAGAWFAVAQLRQLVPWVTDVHRNGQGYASTAWHESEILARVRALPATTRIFSNGDDAIYLLTGRLADRIPEWVSPTTTAANDHYAAELARLRTQLTDSHGVVVYFSRIDWRPNLVSAAELHDRMNLQTLYAAGDGSVFTIQE